MSENTNQITVLEDASGAQTFTAYRGPSVEDAVVALAESRKRLQGRKGGGSVSMYVSDRDQDVMVSLAYEIIEGVQA